MQHPRQGPGARERFDRSVSNSTYESSRVAHRNQAIPGAEAEVLRLNILSSDIIAISEIKSEIKTGERHRLVTGARRR